MEGSMSNRGAEPTAPPRKRARGEPCGANRPPSPKPRRTPVDVWRGKFLQESPVSGAPPRVVIGVQSRVRSHQNMFMDLLTQEQCAERGVAECPITMDPMDSSECAVCPGGRILPDRPELCGAVLPCGHIAGAVPLLYHFFMSNVKCPMCRGGPGVSMQPSCIPPHLRGPITRHVASLRAKERREAEELDRNMARQMVAEMMGTGGLAGMQGVVVVDMPTVRLTVTFLDELTPPQPAPRVGASPARASARVASAVAPPTPVRSSRLLEQRASAPPAAGTLRPISSVEYQMRFVDGYIYRLDDTSLRHLGEFISILGPTHARFAVDAFDSLLPSVPLSATDVFEITDFVTAGWAGDQSVAPPMSRLEVSGATVGTTRTIRTTLDTPGSQIEVGTARGDVFLVNRPLGAGSRISSFEWRTSTHVLPMIMDAAVNLM